MPAPPLRACGHTRWFGHTHSLLLLLPSLHQVLRSFHREVNPTNLVLSVDDDTINQMVVENLLVPEGYKVRPQNLLVPEGFKVRPPKPAGARGIQGETPQTCWCQRDSR